MINGHLLYKVNIHSTNGYDMKIDYKYKGTDLYVQLGIHRKRMLHDHDKLIPGGTQHQRNHRYSCCNLHPTNHSHTRSCIHPEC